ncbi:hypothetical protein [Rhodococcus sp. USK13]|uniref:hypothetical protein n=1 Tax=Rhodococcus sp. USK13 TaxID=2806442 RepID=UPI001BCB6C98
MPAHPATVAAYLVDAADTIGSDGIRVYAPATLTKWVAAIAHHHHRAGHESPTGQETVRATLSGIRRDYAAVGDRPRNPRPALLTADIVAIVTAARNAVTGWAGALLLRGSLRSSSACPASTPTREHCCRCEKNIPASGVCPRCCPARRQVISRLSHTTAPTTGPSRVSF